ncbi:MAG TPA: nicotinate-nucleotide--dimethylbenzimidazole phosphoribosyltransferase [bacterium]|nr:nicotinate-nucleotide--dimethylbenzimidazole phosphoribosyltransferase [bacterium]
MNLQKILSSIPSLDARAMKKAEHRQSQLTKPAGSLGRLEAIAIQVAGITRQAVPTLGKKRVILCAADHGVTQEGVSAFPSAVTPMMVLNFLAGGAAINALARQAGAEVQVVDLGVASDLPKHPKLLSKRIAPGTRNFRQGPAMTPAECEKALAVGLQLAAQAKKDKVTFVVLGEMGIGNTTSAAALMAGLLPCAVEDVTGFGTGIDRTQWLNKCRVIHESIKRHRPMPDHPLEALQRVGGLEIAALTGVVLGCAKARIPVVVDGFITSSAFLVAYRANPKVKDFAFFSHRSEEPGHSKFYEMLGVEPLLEMKMRLGEGTGGALALNLLESALRAHAEMATFQSAKVPGKNKAQRTAVEKKRS